jgi:sortase (surface protein transpeptidase)
MSAAGRPWRWAEQCGAVAVAVAVAITAASATGGNCRSGGPSVEAPSLPSGAATAPLVAADAGTNVDLSGSPTRAPSTAPVPTEVNITAIGVHASVVPLGRNPDGSTEVPQSFQAAGWYEDGPRPGDPGPAVILGHVDSLHGPAVFYHLKELSPGQLIEVSGAGESYTFRVDTVASFTKDHFPTALVFDPVPVPALRLVTCGGSFDDKRRSYRSNVVVFATKVST